MLHLSNKATREFLLRELAFPGRLGGLIVSVHGLRQLEPQVLEILLKGLDFAQPLLLRLP